MTTNGCLNGQSNGNTTSSLPLKISVIGAGIGGLTAAIALRKQGHDVRVCLSFPIYNVQILRYGQKIFEQSAFAREAGAAVHLAPNANGILRRLGIIAEEFGANEMERVSLTCKHPGNSIDLTNALT